MIIKTDVRSISLNRFSLDLRPRDAAASARKTDQVPYKTITNRLAVERSLGDALSIAQMSQNVIQQAMTISMRLQNIALNAAATGRVDTPALNEAIADIRTTLEGYGGLSPVTLRPPDPGTAVKTIETPDIKPEMTTLGTISGALQAGNYNQFEKINSLIDNLKEKSSAFQSIEGTITKKMRETAPGYGPLQDISADAAISQVKKRMETNPEYALIAQGNIHHAATDKLISLSDNK